MNPQEQEANTLCCAVCGRSEPDVRTRPQIQIRPAPVCEEHRYTNPWTPEEMREWLTERGWIKEAE